MKKNSYFISFDFEGLAGITNWQETLEKERFRVLATDQVNAFLQGLFESEPEAAVTIADAHSRCSNLIWERLTGNTELIKGYPRRFYMLEGLDQNYDGLILFGYHAPAGHEGNMDHTYSSSLIYRLSINGREADEAMINTILASESGVPLKLVYTDDKGAEWIRTNLSSEPEILISKQAISRFSARIPPYEKIKQDLREAGRKLHLSGSYLPEQESEYSLRLEFIDSNIGYAVQILPVMRKIDARTVEFKTADFKTAYRYLIAAIMIGNSVKELYR